MIRCWIWFTGILLRILCPCLSGILAGSLIFYCVFSSFWFQGDAGFFKRVRENFIFHFFGIFAVDWYQLFLYLVELESIWPAISLVGKFFISDSNLELNICLSSISISSCFYLWSLCVSRNVSISSRFSRLCA